MDRTRTLDLQLELLDREIVDADGAHLGKVDDLELEEGADGTLRVTALLLGPEALGPRFDHRIGDWISGVGRRLRGDASGPLRVPAEHVAALGNLVELDTTIAELGVEPRSETWLREHLIVRIPGADHASE